MNLRNHHGQMSESLLTASFIILSGGLQDAYTYLCRGKVFANAQTGNIVLCSAYLFDGQWRHSARYLIPVLSFLLGIFAAECIHRHFKYTEKVHWRQMIILAEIALLFAVGFLPQGGQHLRQRRCVLCLCHAGADLPQGPGPRLRQYHVHRQYAQRHGSPVRLFPHP